MVRSFHLLNYGAILIVLLLRWDVSNNTIMYGEIDRFLREGGDENMIMLVENSGTSFVSKFSGTRFRGKIMIFEFPFTTWRSGMTTMTGRRLLPTKRSGKCRRM